VSEFELRVMLQTLLAERFKLKFHTDTKEMPGYELLVAKSGPKLTPNNGADCVPDAEHVCGLITRIGQIRGQDGTMPQFADVLSGFMDRPVADKTGLTGSFKDL